MSGALLTMQILQLSMMQNNIMQQHHEQAEHSRQSEHSRLEEQARHRHQNEDERKRSYNNHMSKADAYLKDGQIQHAKIEFEQALRLFSNDLPARFWLACCLAKQHDHRVAYDMFMQLTNFSAQLPDLEAQIQGCVIELIRVSTEALQQAKDLYTAGANDGAMSKLIFARALVPNHSAAGQKLGEEIDHFRKQIEWENKRFEISQSFIFGQNQLRRKEFEDAKRTFTKCAEAYEEYAAFLSVEELSSREELTTLLEQTQHSIKLRTNAQLQNLVNEQLCKLNQALESYDIDNATILLTEAEKLNAQINIDDPADIAEDYQKQQAFAESLLTLQQFKADSEARCQEQSGTIARAVLRGVTATMPLSSKDINLVQQLLERLISMNWRELDRRSLAALEQPLVQQTQNCLLKTSCVYTCLYNGFYVGDIVELERLLLNVILSNLPNDYREPIKLAVATIAEQIIEESDPTVANKSKLKLGSTG